MSLTACGAFFFDNSRAIGNYAQIQIGCDHNKGFFRVFLAQSAALEVQRALVVTLTSLRLEL